MSDEQGQTRSHGQGKTGRMTRSNDSAVDLKMAGHTLDLVLNKLSVIGAPLGKHEAERVRAEIEADVALVQRTLEGVQRRMR